MSKIRVIYVQYHVNFTDVDECLDQSLCRGGSCVNEPGSYRCVCPGGLELSTDGSTCIGKSALGVHCLSLHITGGVNALWFLSLMSKQTDGTDKTLSNLLLDYLKFK